MIEVPRGALTADEIAARRRVLLLRHQRPHRRPTLGVSRDDAGRFLVAVRATLEIYARDPFEIDRPRRRRRARCASPSSEGRAARPRPQARHLRRARRRPELDRASATQLGLDYVSCSPVPPADRPPRRRTRRSAELASSSARQPTEAAPAARCVLRRRRAGCVRRTLCETGRCKAYAARRLRRDRPARVIDAPASRVTAWMQTTPAFRLPSRKCDQRGARVPTSLTRAAHGIGASCGDRIARSEAMA